MSESIKIPGLPEHVLAQRYGSVMLGEFFLNTDGCIWKLEPGFTVTALVVEPAPGYQFEHSFNSIYKVVPEKRTYIVLKFKKPDNWRGIMQAWAGAPCDASEKEVRE